jgi:hypothetical protein
MDVKVVTQFILRNHKKHSFFIQLLILVNTKWKEVLRVDTATHGDKRKLGKAHIHKFYTNRKSRVRPVSGASFDSIYDDWLVNLTKRTENHIQNYMHNR